MLICLLSRSGHRVKLTDLFKLVYNPVCVLQSCTGTGMLAAFLKIPNVLFLLTESLCRHLKGKHGLAVVIDIKTSIGHYLRLV